MLKEAFPIILAVGAGVSLVVQQALNSNLRVALKSAVWSGFVSYLVGLLCMTALALALREAIPTAETMVRIPWWTWVGGFFGALFIGMGIFLVPQLGAATFFALLIAGQMLGSLLFDHFGLLGVPVHPMSAIRLLGAGLLVAGVVLVRI